MEEAGGVGGGLQKTRNVMGRLGEKWIRGGRAGIVEVGEEGREGNVEAGLEKFEGAGKGDMLVRCLGEMEKVVERARQMIGLALVEGRKKRGSIMEPEMREESILGVGVAEEGRGGGVVALAEESKPCGEKAAGGGGG